MNKKLIRLTESDLHRIVKESVNRILMESKGLDPSKRDSEFASNIKWSGEPDLDKANEWRKSWHNTHRGEKKVKGDTKFRDMARKQNERGNFIHKLKTNQDEWLRNYVKEDYNPFDNDDFEEWDRINVSPISDEEYNEIMRMNPMQNSSYIFNKIGFNKWNGFVSRWGKENPEECERFWQSQMAF